jgi:alpha-L-fucosidase
MLGLLLCGVPVQSQSYQPNWQSLDKRATPAWFDEAKFGIFIHWGIYSVPAWAPTRKDSSAHKWGNTIHYAEWYWKLLNEKVSSFPNHHARVYGSNFQYPDFAKDFKAEYFDPAQWADVLAKSGAKYVVLTSKHHEGFTLWPSRYSKGWNAVAIGPKQDLAGNLSKAVKARGLRMGYYYSLYEWYNPLYKMIPGSTWTRTCYPN